MEACNVTKNELFGIYFKMILPRFSTISSGFSSFRQNPISPSVSQLLLQSRGIYELDILVHFVQYNFFEKQNTR